MPRLIIGSRHDERLARTGHEVTAEVTAKDRQHLTIEYRLPGSESTVREAKVNGSDGYASSGGATQAHVDDDGDARLDADPYNAGGPIAWLVTAWIATALDDVAGRSLVARCSAGRPARSVVHGERSRRGRSRPGSRRPTSPASRTPRPAPRRPARRRRPRRCSSPVGLKPGDAVAVVGPYRSAGHGCRRSISSGPAVRGLTSQLVSRSLPFVAAYRDTDVWPRSATGPGGPSSSASPNGRGRR